MTESPLMDLEIRIAFQEDAIATLDALVRDQQRHIEQLEHRYRELRMRVEELLTHEGDTVLDTRPPHY
jgi:SlyX protein